MASSPGPFLVDSVQSNSSWILALSAARNGGVVHGGWKTFSPQVEQRLFSNGDVYTEDEFMAVHGFATYYPLWKQGSLVTDRPTAWQEALSDFGLVSVKTVCHPIPSRDKARDLIVDILSKHLAYGNDLMSKEIAGQWADSFLAPVNTDTDFFTGTADTATINQGVVFVQNDTVGCLWVGDED
ncbi:unnamed protein product [Heterosigma akashiwo]|mmetsp:Transcript_19733/g.27163  ORF Transcript_19733/g.27163 Transcript_19733/m.27163 type:complete len:183 (+) Transcript_19733:49-597(+)